MGIRETIASDLDIPESLIFGALAGARRRVKKFEIQKRNGGSRVIHHPDKKLKTIQYWLIARIFESMPVHGSAAAYIRGRSILWNANRHRNGRYFVKIDFKDFFPSIYWRDLKPLVDTWHQNENPDWELTDEAYDLIRLSCFFRNDSLAIGFPSSPIISNVVMFSIDTSIENIFSDKDKFGNLVYTRYADDIIVSTNKRNVSSEILRSISALIESSPSPKLSINRKKTRVSSSASGSAIVTGLRICPDGHVTIHRRQKDHIRLMLSLYEKEKLPESEQISLMGHLSYIRFVAPRFYNKLQNKHFHVINQLRSNPLR